MLFSCKIVENTQFRNEAKKGITGKKNKKKMKKKTEASLWATMACAATIGGMWSYGEYQAFCNDEANTTSPLLIENVEALTGNETNTTWMVRESKCTVFIGRGKKICLTDGTTLEADAAGFVTIDGRLDYEEGGEASFRPVSCSDLYEKIGN